MPSGTLTYLGFTSFTQKKIWWDHKPTDPGEFYACKTQHQAPTSDTQQLTGKLAEPTHESLKKMKPRDSAIPGLHPAHRRRKMPQHQKSTTNHPNYKAIVAHAGSRKATHTLHAVGSLNLLFFLSILGSQPLEKSEHHLQHLNHDLERKSGHFKPLSIGGRPAPAPLSGRAPVPY